MKRLIAFFIVMAAAALCMASCTVPLKTTSTRKNGLGCPFTAKVSVTLDKLQADGELERFGDGVWDIEFSSPNTLSGVTLAFSSGCVEASYKGLSFSVPQSALPVKAMMLNLIAAVDENARLSELKGEEKDDLLEICGKLEGGDYTLTVDKEGRLCGFDMPNNSLKMVFTEVRNGDGAPSLTETTSCETASTAPETSSETTTTSCTTETTSTTVCGEE